MSERLPNFVVIGAPKSGTTSLYFYLRQHPQIFLPEQKELHYFSYDLLAANMAGPGDRDVLPALCASQESYRWHYRAVGQQRAVGEVSPSYLFYHQVASRIQRELGAVKIIALLRNPVEKAYSQYMHLVREYRETESFYNGLMLEAERMRKGWSDLWLYASSSLYSPGVSHYISTFGSENVKIVLAQDLFQQPRETLRSIFRYLGVDDTFQPADTGIYNPSGTPRSRMISAALSKPGKAKDLIKKVIPAAWRDRLWYALLNLNTGKKDSMDQQSREYLGKYFHDDVVRLEKILGIQTHWLDPEKGSH